MKTKVRRKKPVPKRFGITLDSDDLLLSLDVSSMAIGWAVLTGEGEVESFGLVKSVAHRPVWHRITAMTDQLEREVGTAFRMVVIEVQSVTAPGAWRSSLVTLCHAQGAVYQYAASTGVPAFAVTEQEWTRCRPKRERACTAMVRCPAYRDWTGGHILPETIGGTADPGLDVADALGLGFWTLDQLEKERAEPS